MSYSTYPLHLQASFTPEQKAAYDSRRFKSWLFSEEYFDDMNTAAAALMIIGRYRVEGLPADAWFSTVHYERKSRVYRVTVVSAEFDSLPLGTDYPFLYVTFIQDKNAPLGDSELKTARLVHDLSEAKAILKRGAVVIFSPEGMDYP